MTGSLFERHTERARRVLFFARYEAGRAGSPAVEPEHLLLALIREGTGLSARIFERARVSPDEVRRTIESQTTRRAATSSGEDLPLSASTNQVLEFAAQESDRLLHNYVGTEHLLLGVFREQRSLAASILAERGLQINQVRDEIVMLLCAPPVMPPVRQTKPDIPPSTEVTIKPTERRPHEGVSARRASDYWVLESIPLKDMLSRLHDIQKKRISTARTISTSARRPKAANSFFTRCAIGWGSRPRRHGATSRCSSCATPEDHPGWRFASAAAVVGGKGAENGRSANHKTALIFSIVIGRGDVL